MTVKHTTGNPASLEEGSSLDAAGIIPDALARAFIDLLRRDAGHNARSLLQVPAPDDPVDSILDLLADPADKEPEVNLAPDLIGATIMLARGIERSESLLRDLRRGAPVVVVEVPNAEQVKLVENALRNCALGSSVPAHDGDRWAGDYRTSRNSREAVLFSRDGTGTSHTPMKGNPVVASALQMGMALIGIAMDAHRHLPRDLVRGCEHYMPLEVLDPSGIALVIESVTGSPPTEPLDEKLARVVELADLALAVRHDRGPEGSMLRLRELLAAKLSESDGPDLADLEGYGAAKTWGLNLSEDLQAYRQNTLPWAAVDKGILLSGPPGVGKTQFGLALARTCQVPFLAGSLAQWQASREGHLGHCLAAMRAAFEDARKLAPCVLMVDEIDSFGDRNEFAHANKDYSVQVVNAFLECLDGAVSREGVVVIGATNNPDRIDAAIRRPGRLDTHVEIPRPDVAALRAILRHHLGPDTLADVDLGPAAVAARGATGADCEAWARRAKARARRAGREPELADLLGEIGAGIPPMPPEVRRRVAVHEAGHGLVAVVLGIATRVTLGFQANGNGFTEVDDGFDGSLTEAGLDRRLAFILAGRAAEQLAFGDMAAGSGGGPGSDLATATRLALMAESRFGFGDRHALCYFGGSGGDVRLDDIPWFTGAVSERLERAYTAATNLLAARRPALMRVADALEANGYLEDAEVRPLVEGPAAPRFRRPKRPAPRP